MKYPDQSTINLIQESAQVCRDAARANLGTNLEFDEDSILKIDDLISRGWQPGQPSSMTLQVWGCYLGEAMRQTLHGSWVLTDSGLGIAVGHAVAHPLAKMEKRFVHGVAEEITLFYKAFKQLCIQPPAVI